MNAPSLPRLAMVLGDPAGIGPELIARLLADTEVREKAHIVLIADEAEMRRGMRIAGCEFPYRRIDALETLDFADATPLLHPWLSQGGDEFPRSEASAVGGRYSLETLALALVVGEDDLHPAVLRPPPVGGVVGDREGFAVADHLHARLDLTLWLEDQPQGWLAVWTGASAIFDLDRIERLHQAWERRLLANAGEPTSKRMSPEGCNAS